MIYRRRISLRWLPHPSAITGARLKEEGATSGVSDLILLKSNRFYGGLCIEMKKPGGRQSPAQKEWQKDAEANGLYAVLVILRLPAHFVRLRFFNHLLVCHRLFPYVGLLLCPCRSCRQQPAFLLLLWLSCNHPVGTG